jgi:hypothetical protein
MAHHVAERLEEFGIAHILLHFRTVRGTATLYLAPFLGILVSIGAAWFYPLAGLIGATAFALLALLEATNRPIVSRIFRLDSSQNVVGLIPHQPPEGVNGDNPLRRVVLITPIDSPRLGWLDSASMQRMIRGLTIVTLFCIMLIPLLLPVGLFLDDVVWLILAAVGLTNHMPTHVITGGYLIDTAYQLIYCIGTGAILGAWR